MHVSPMLCRNQKMGFSLHTPFPLSPPHCSAEASKWNQPWLCQSCVKGAKFKTYTALSPWWLEESATNPHHDSGTGTPKEREGQKGNEQAVCKGWGGGGDDAVQGVDVYIYIYVIHFEACTDHTHKQWTGFQAIISPSRSALTYEQPHSAPGGSFAGSAH